MHRHADGSCLIRNGAGNGLPNPPGCICREFVSLCPVKLVYRANETCVALLNKIQNMQPSAGIFLGDGNHQPEVCLGQLVFRFLIAIGDALGKLHFLIGGKQPHLADFFQIHPNRVVQIVFRHQLHRVNQFLFFYIGKVHIIQIAQKIQPIVQFYIQFVADDLNTQGVKPIVKLLDFFRGDVQLFQLGVQLRSPENAVFSALGNQRLNGSVGFLGAAGLFLSVAHNDTPLSVRTSK